MRFNRRQIVLALQDELSLGAVKQIEPVEQGAFNWVFKAGLSDQNVFVRINRDPEVFPIERAAYQRGAERGVPVPEVIGYLPHSAHTGNPTLVLGEVKGEPLNRAELANDDRQRVYEQAGAMLRQLHGSVVEGYGSLALRDNVLHGTSLRWQDYWKTDNRRDLDLASIVRDGLVSAAEFSLVEQAIDAILAADIDQAVLLHNDFHDSHLFTDGRRITGVIDFGNALAGDPRYDIAMSLFFCEPLEAEGFKRGYGALVLDPMVEMYAIYVAAIKVQWRHRAGNIAGAECALTRLRAARPI